MVTAESNILAIYQHHQSVFSYKLLEHECRPTCIALPEITNTLDFINWKKRLLFLLFPRNTKAYKSKEEGSPYLVSKQNKDTYTQNPKLFYVDVIEIYLK